MPDQGHGFGKNRLEITGHIAGNDNPFQIGGIDKPSEILGVQPGLNPQFLDGFHIGQVGGILGHRSDIQSIVFFDLAEKNSSTHVPPLEIDPEAIKIFHQGKMI